MAAIIRTNRALTVGNVRFVGDERCQTQRTPLNSPKSMPPGQPRACPASISKSSIAGHRAVMPSSPGDGISSIRNARLADRSSAELSDIGVGNGRIVAIERRLAADAEVYDAEGRLACPGLIESHIHLDKSRIMDRCAPQERAQLSPIKGVAPLKKSMTVEDIRARAERTLQLCILHGTTRMRTQVEVDPGIGMRGFDAVASLARDYKWAIDIEICVFPQEGLTNYPGTDELLVEGLKRGAKVLGGAPRYDTDHAGQIERIFALAPIGEKISSEFVVARGAVPLVAAIILLN
jgi:hypothetical protein